MSETISTKKVSRANAEETSAPLHALDSPEGIAELKNYVAATLNLNHDLNNPLAGIMGFLELALGRADKMEPKVLELLKLVEKSAAKLNERLLEFTNEKRKMQDNVDISELEQS